MVFHLTGTLVSCRIDVDGDIFNYAEKEQLVEVNGDRNSFVETRGSISLFRQQEPNLKYKPKPQ